MPVGFNKQKDSNATIYTAKDSTTYIIQPEKNGNYKVTYPNENGKTTQVQVKKQYDNFSGLSEYATDYNGLGSQNYKGAKYAALLVKMMESGVTDITKMTYAQKEKWFKSQVSVSGTGLGKVSEYSFLDNNTYSIKPAKLPDTKN